MAIDCASDQQSDSLSIATVGLLSSVTHSISTHTAAADANDGKAINNVMEALQLSSIDIIRARQISARATGT